MHIRPIITLFLIVGISFCSPLPAQNSGPYYLSAKRDLWYGAAGVSSLLVGEYLRSKTPELTIQDLDIDEINQFDRVATRMSSGEAAEWSDIMLYSSIGLTGALLLGEKTRNDFGRITILFLETMAINGGITNIHKSSYLRPRPYVFHDNWNPEQILSSGDRASFVSGHTSGSAAGAFFFAKVFSDYYPDSKLKPYVWVVAISLPALTGYLRVRAGRHYPTDVIAGYIMGAGIGILVPALHKKPINERKLTLAPTGNGVILGYRF